MAVILVVDDDDAIAEMVSLRLRMQGHEIHRAHNGQEGIDNAFSLKPDLILMDMQMPVVDGRTAVITLRDRQYEGLICSLSASARQADINEAINIGCNANITKPIGRDFEDRVHDILNGS